MNVCQSYRRGRSFAPVPLVAAAMALLMAGGFARAAEQPATAPYIDPAQLDCPFPKHSFYKQPWRGFLETRDGREFLDGIGINYNIPDGKFDDLAVRLLAESGFKAFRIEIGWGSVDWDEQHINNEKRYRHLLELCKRYGIRPNLLLNAHHGVPEPVKFFNGELAAAAPAGSRTVTLKDTKQIVVGYTGLSELTDYWAAEALITAVNVQSGECTLSKPLPKALTTDKPLKLATLKYLPLYPVGTKEYEATAGGWLRYATMVTQLAADAGIEEFDVEVWNELSFGSNFTHASHYFDPNPFKADKDFLHPGGTCWELAKRTVDLVKAKHPKAAVIWGFSNTTFYHCPIAELPPGIDGQSYHPYGTGTRKLPDQETHRDHPDFNLEGYTPTIDLRMSEGWAHEWIQTEGIMRLLNTASRQAHPAGVESGHFFHYMTEHGVLPIECGITDDAGCWDIKTKCALRSFCFWLNKGVHRMDYFCAWEDKPQGFGLMPPDLAKLPADVPWDTVATEPMRAMRTLVKLFDGASPAGSRTPLTIDIQELGEPRKIFDGDAKHPPLMQRDAIAVLPWQVSAQKFVIAAYAMTYDITKPFPDEPYRLRVGGVPADLKSVKCVDVLSGKSIALSENVTGNGTREWDLPLSDTPRLIVVEK